MSAAEASARYRAKNRDKSNAVSRRCIWRALGLNMTEDTYQQMCIAQHDRCAICRKRSVRRFHVDHKHNTKRVRGLLCHKCNLGLGHFNDSLLRLRAAINYLERTN